MIYKLQNFRVKFITPASYFIPLNIPNSIHHHSFTVLSQTTRSSATFSNLIWSVFNWNIHGVNDKDKWLMVINKVEDISDPIKIYMPETKKAYFHNSNICKFAPRLFVYFVPSVGASGGGGWGQLVLWNNKVFSRRISMQKSFGK
jgi:hypothetical protein